MITATFTQGGGTYFSELISLIIQKVISASNGTVLVVVDPQVGYPCIHEMKGHSSKKEIGAYLFPGTIVSPFQIFPDHLPFLQNVENYVKEHLNVTTVLIRTHFSTNAHYTNPAGPGTSGLYNLSLLIINFLP